MPYKDKSKEKEFKRLRHQRLKNDPVYKAKRKSLQKKWQQNNKEKVNAIAKRGRVKNTENRRKWAQRNKEKLADQFNKKTKNLTDAYLNRRLKKMGYSEGDITSELRDRHRLVILKYRLIKTINRL